MKLLRNITGLLLSASLLLNLTGCGGSNDNNDDDTKKKNNKNTYETSVSSTDSWNGVESSNGSNYDISSLTVAVDGQNIKVTVAFEDTPAFWENDRICVLIDDTDLTSNTVSFSDNGYYNLASYTSTSDTIDYYFIDIPKAGSISDYTGASLSSEVTSDNTWSYSNYLYTASSDEITYTIPLTAISGDDVTTSDCHTYKVAVAVSGYWYDDSKDVTQIKDVIPSAAFNVSKTDNEYDTAAISMSSALSKTPVASYTIGSESAYIPAISAALGSDFIRGFDASACYDDSYKGKYQNASGTVDDIFETLKAAGANYVRLRVWNNPSSSNNPEKPGNSTKDVVVEQAVAAKAAGLKVLIDFHYSDYWTDPGQQAIPDSWKSNTTADEMAKSVYDWTEEVLEALSDAEVEVDMVQVGNEINSGILRNIYTSGIKSVADATISGCSWNSDTKANFTKYLASGISAVRTYAPTAKVVLHVAGGGADIAWLFDIFKNASLNYDIAGLSYYPFEESHGTLTALESNIKLLKKTYDKDVIIAETAHRYKSGGSTDEVTQLKNATSNLVYNDELFPTVETDSDGIVEASIQNQVNVISAIMQVSANAGAIGVFTWGGERLGDWQYGLFDSDGLPFPSLYVLSVKGN